MLDQTAEDHLKDAETEFRHRLVQKLAARGYEGAAIDRKVEELLRRGVKLRLNIDEITRA